MKINQIISETTTAGAVAPVSQSFVKMQSRNPVVSSKKGNNLLTGKVTKKPYMNSIEEGKKDFAAKIAGKIAKSNKDKKDTEEKVKQHQQDQKKDKVDEAKLDEDDIIVVPGRGSKRKTGFVKHGESRVDHEVEMARSDVLATMKNAKAIYELLKDRTEEEGIEGWVQEKLIKANDYLNAVKEYYDEKMISNEGVPPAGTIAGGGFEESSNPLKIPTPRPATDKELKLGYSPSKSHVLGKDGMVYYFLDPKLKSVGRMDTKGNVNEKAKSKQQQKFMGMVHAMQKGEKIPGASKELKAAAKGMSMKAAHDYAATKHKGLPKKVKQKD